MEKIESRKRPGRIAANGLYQRLQRVWNGHLDGLANFLSSCRRKGFKDGHLFDCLVEELIEFFARKLYSQSEPRVAQDGRPDTRLFALADLEYACLPDDLCGE